MTSGHLYFEKIINNEDRDCITLNIFVRTEDDVLKYTIKTNERCYINDLRSYISYLDENKGIYVRSVEQNVSREILEVKQEKIKDISIDRVAYKLDCLLIGIRDKDYFDLEDVSKAIREFKNDILKLKEQVVIR